MPEYYKIRKLGEGTYATIYLAKEVDSERTGFIKTDPENKFRRMVAIKKIKTTEYGTGLEVNAIREIKAMKLFNNEYLLGLLNIFIHKGNILLILEYMDHNLEHVLRSKEILLMPQDIKSWLYMLLTGVKAMHDKFIIHRDLKPNNLLIKDDGTLKVADFGLSRKITEMMTPNAVTRWYRAPEMLLGEKQYTMASDMWSIGAIMAEMFLRVPFFAAETDIQQLDTVCRVLGTPKDYELFNENQTILKLKYYPPVNFKGIFTAVSEDAINLLEKFLQFDPRKRISVDDALNHEYFRNKPLATKIGHLPIPKTSK